MLDSKMSKTTFFLFIGFLSSFRNKKKSFNGYLAIPSSFRVPQGVTSNLTFAISGREGADVQNEIFVLGQTFNFLSFAH